MCIILPYPQARCKQTMPYETVITRHTLTVCINRQKKNNITKTEANFIVKINFRVLRAFREKKTTSVRKSLNKQNYDPKRKI